MSIVTERFVLREYLMMDEIEFINYQTDPGFSVHYSDKELGEEHARSVFQKFMTWQVERPRLNLGG